MTNAATMIGMVALAPIGGSHLSTLATILYHLVGFLAFFHATGESEFSAVKYGMSRVGLDLVLLSSSLLTFYRVIINAIVVFMSIEHISFIIIPEY